MIDATTTTPDPASAVPYQRLDFVLDAEHEAHQPPEIGKGRRRDDVRLLVSVGDAAPVHTRFAALGEFLAAGDLVVVNTSATVPAAVDGRLPDGDPIVLHFSGEMPGGEVLVEVRQPVAGTTAPRFVDAPVDVDLLGAGRVRLHAPFAGSRRLWLASADLAGAPDLPSFLAGHGRPIRYRHVPRDWPIEAYQTVFAREPGSVEMPSAARPFTTELVTDLVGRGIAVAPLLLHTGVSSLEGDERPYPERYRVPRATADAINGTRQNGGRVIATGTTVVRALATVTDDRGVVHPGRGWTEEMVTPDTPVRSVDGLITGWHEPESTHLMMLEAFAGRAALESAYRAALAGGYLWHEFGDSHLIVRADASR
jgi:S-adenosylmethionine:tRNA ribosyltransferase-isomerase